MDSNINTMLNTLAVIVEVGGGLLIGLACVQALFRSLRMFSRSSAYRQASAREVRYAKEDIMLDLGGWLAIALQFLVGADILRTAVQPHWDEIIELAAIIILRILLGYFMQKELEKVEVRRHAVGAAGGSAATPWSGPA